MTTPAEASRPPAVPRHAATVILLREERGAIEVLLTRRHEQMAFMGGMWVFPGGALCPADTSSAALALIRGPEKLGCERFLDLQNQPLSPALCLGLAMAACRETFEETGILLATAADGHDVGDGLLERMRERRHAIVSQPELFATLLAEQQLRLDAAELLYWAHWITPSAVAKRFDTRFFVARLPPKQVPAIDAIEATQMAWMTPAAAITAARDDAMTLSPPTLFTLMEIDAGVRQHISLDEIFATEARRDIVAVLPKLVRGERSAIVMPWDSEYHMLIGSGSPLENSYPERLRTLSSRIFIER